MGGFEARKDFVCGSLRRAAKKIVGSCVSIKKQGNVGGEKIVKRVEQCWLENRKRNAIATLFQVVFGLERRLELPEEGERGSSDSVFH